MGRGRRCWEGGGRAGLFCCASGAAQQSAHPPTDRARRTLNHATATNEQHHTTLHHATTTTTNDTTNACSGANGFITRQDLTRALSLQRPAAFEGGDARRIEGELDAGARAESGRPVLKSFINLSAALLLCVWAGARRIWLPAQSASASHSLLVASCCHLIISITSEHATNKKHPNTNTKKTNKQSLPRWT